MSTKMLAKKDNPDYKVIRGHVPKELYKRFKVFCLDHSADNSQGLEILLTEYFELKDLQTSQLANIKESA